MLPRILLCPLNLYNHYSIGKQRLKQRSSPHGRCTLMHTKVPKRRSTDGLILQERWSLSRICSAKGLEDERPIDLGSNRMALWQEIADFGNTPDVIR